MIFTIDNDNDIRLHETESQAEEAAKGTAGTIVVRNEKELNKAAAEWPAGRLVEVWSSFAGVAPFTDCKPVKKFERRAKAVARIWITIQQLGNAIEPKPVEDPKPPPDAKPAAETEKAGKSKAAKSAKPAPKAKATKGKKTAAGKPREGTYRAEVMAMIQRKGGATLGPLLSGNDQQLPAHPAPVTPARASW